MTPAAYKTERERRGTQKEVASALGVSRVTIARRETSTRPVIREAWLALLALPKKRARAKRPNYYKYQRDHED
jgi:transcriptional regulator with XRE-family HTH domain